MTGRARKVGSSNLVAVFRVRGAGPDVDRERQSNSSAEARPHHEPRILGGGTVADACEDGVEHEHDDQADDGHEDEH